MTSVVLPYDVDAIRRDFPILQQEHHDGVPLTFLDSAASSQKPNAVIEAMNHYYQHQHANVHRGIHKLSEEATEAYETARKKVKRFINAKSWREVIFTRGTTESLNLLAHTWGRANLQPGDVMLSTVMEHHSNIVPWQILADQVGFEIKYIPVLRDGSLDLDAYANFLESLPVKLVAVVHSSNVLGTINPIAVMTKLAHDHGALVAVDAAQSVPHMPIDVQQLDVDFLAFSGHKMAGPTGIGVLYGKRALLNEMPPWMGGGDMISRVSLDGSTWNELPYKFEAGTPSIAEAIGLGVAVDYLSAIGMDAIHQHEQVLTNDAIERLSEIPFVKLLNGEVPERGGVVTFTVDGIHAHDVAQLLDENGIAVRAGHHCAMPLHDYLHVDASVRASFYLYNRLEEVDLLVDGLHQAKQIFNI